MWLSTTCFQPFDVFITRDVGILAVNALAGPVCGPVRSVAQKLCSAKSVRQHDQERSLIRLLPQLEYPVLRSLQGMINRRERGEDHGNLVRVGADRFQVVFVSEEGVGSSGKVAAQVF